MRGQTSFEAYPIFFGRRRAQIVKRLVRLVVADQQFTKVGAQTGANVHEVVPASVQRVSVQVFRLGVHRFMQDH